MEVRDSTDVSHKDERLVIFIRQLSLDKFWSREPGILRGNLKIFKKMGMMDREELGLEDFFTSGNLPAKI